MQPSAPPPKHNPCARAEDSTAYDVHSRSLHSRARTAHATWLASMLPAERKRIREMNLEAPPDDSPEVGGHSPYSLSDIADTPLARVVPDYAGAIDTPQEILADEFNLTAQQSAAILTWHAREIETAVTREKASYLQIIVGGLLSSKNPKLNAAGLAFAANLAALNGLPCQREYARQNHVSASAISKVVKAWQEALGLRPSAHQKSETACQTYSQVGKNNHWRDRSFKASMATRLLTRIRSKSDPSLN